MSVCVSVCVCVCTRSETTLHVGHYSIINVVTEACTHQYKLNRPSNVSKPLVITKHRRLPAKRALQTEESRHQSREPRGTEHACNNLQRHVVWASENSHVVVWPRDRIAHVDSHSHRTVGVGHLCWTHPQDERLDSECGDSSIFTTSVRFLGPD